MKRPFSPWPGTTGSSVQTMTLPEPNGLGDSGKTRNGRETDAKRTPESESETESETEKKTGVLRESIDNSRACAREEPPSSLSGSPFPPDFNAPDDWWLWAAQERPDLDIKTELANFADHYAGKMLVCEPEKIWRKWIRNANTPKPAAHGGGRNPRKEAVPIGGGRFGAILSGMKNPVIEGEVVHEIH